MGELEVNLTNLLKTKNKKRTAIISINESSIVIFSDDFYYGAQITYGYFGSNKDLLVTITEFIFRYCSQITILC